MPRQLQPQQLLTPVPSDIAISDAIAPLPITEIAAAAGIVRQDTFEAAELGADPRAMQRVAVTAAAAARGGGAVRLHQGQDLAGRAQPTQGPAQWQLRRGHGHHPHASG
ncbi:unnamed protein product [Phytophthora lilii]|uniref:Unnamed protein product n=1 Tax=Phytophthora lilii TaxID=2077276 RepID=A0A9W6TC37_9STRA|nr:unnamed protein product [Phytophthora lilii]